MLTPRQRLFLRQYIQSFESGGLHNYKETQKTWIRDSAPIVEKIFGFVEPYRDPFGIRAEFEGPVAISKRQTCSHGWWKSHQDLLNDNLD